MYKIYKIEDCNGLIYIGKTIQNVNDRFIKHKSNKKIKITDCSSHKLDLFNSSVTILEDNITEEDSFEKERYYINSFDCVNVCKLIIDKKEYNKKYRSKQENIDIEKKGRALYRLTHKEEIKKAEQTRRKYQSSWGGNRSSSNNLLRININLFMI